MIVTCPNCQTRFKLAHERLAHSQTLLKCSRCGHVFPRGSESPAGDEQPAADESRPSVDHKAERRSRGSHPKGRDTAQEDLSFVFGDEPAEWTVGDEAETDPEGTNEQFLIDPVPPSERPPLSTRKWRRPDAVAEDGGKEEESGEAEEGGGLRVSLQPVFVFLFLVVTAYAVLAGTMYANPEWADQLGRHLPFISRRDGTLARKVDLVRVSGSYEELRNGQQVFLVTGRAVNQAAVALGLIQVQVRLLGADDSVVAENVIYCGSSIPVKLIRDLSLAEIAVIGRLKPPRTFFVQPGEASPFVAVFTQPLPDVADLSVQVVDARRQI